MLFDTFKVQDIRCTPNGQDFLSTRFCYDSTPHIWNRGGSLWASWSYVGHTRLISRIVNISALPNPIQNRYMWWSESEQREHTIPRKKKMAAKVALSSSFSSKFPLPPKPSLPSHFPCTYILPKTRVHHLRIHANLGKRFLCIQMYFPKFYLCSFLANLGWKMITWEDKILVLLGGGEGEIKKGGKKKFITREEEPEQ